MAIVKSKHASNYTVIPNDLFKSGMSLEAIGMLVYLLSLPHDWVVYKTTLHEKFGLGKEKTHRIFKELQQFGYVISVQKFAENGRFEYQHVVYDKPFNNENLTDTANTETVSTDSADSPLLSKQLTKETYTKDILSFLNQTCKTDFKFTSKKTCSLINARMSEGFTVKDFEYVIKSKFKEWGSDLKMSVYLRPETLFGTKFEGYLQVAKRDTNIIDKYAGDRLPDNFNPNA